MNATQKTLVKALRGAMNVRSANSKRAKEDVAVFAEMERIFRSNSETRVAADAHYGVQYARQTGRIDGTLEMHLRALKLWQYLNLLALVASDIKTAGDVPRWLMENRETVMGI